MARPTKDLFYQLTPDFVLNAVEKMGWRTTGEYLQLNSYENRVYSLHLESTNDGPGDWVVAKFYRPERWDEGALRAEHEFLQELINGGVSAIAPLRQKNNDTLSLHDGLWATVFPRARARMPQELSSTDLESIGRVLARLHNIGEQRQESRRIRFDVEHFGLPALNAIEPLLPSNIRERYLDLVDELFTWVDDELDSAPMQRIHGDCHRGNILQTDVIGQPSEYFLIDFDDFGVGPVVQDFWMLFRPEDSDYQLQLQAFLAGYEDLRSFDRSQLRWMPGLQGLRIVHYAAWIARRWSDPSFPLAFPQFGSDAYWWDEIRGLERVIQKLG